MSATYRLVNWNRHKVIYDGIVIAGMLLFVVVSMVLGTVLHAGEAAPDPMVQLIGATGALAATMLTIILCIGPLARLKPTLFLPILYNRRHLGVLTFVAAAAHAVLVLLYYGGFGVVNPIEAIYGASGGMPFELFGFLALSIMFVLAATSHDFWLATLSPTVWKSLHMLVYAAFALLVLHVAFGAMQTPEKAMLVPALLGGATVLVGGLHIAAGWRERGRDASGAEPSDGWIDIGSANDIPVDCARVVCVKGAERVAVFREADDDGSTLSAISNVCAHQGGPLGEGKIVDGCVTCPWHGYQYKPRDGTSPPPYSEKLPTYELRLHGKRVLLNPEPLEPGTATTPVRVPADDASGGASA